MSKPSLWNNKKRYYDLKSFWLNRFGCRVYKLQIDAGFTCPNRDGTVSRGGCIYCDGRGSRLRQVGPFPPWQSRSAGARNITKKTEMQESLSPISRHSPILMDQLRN